MASISSLHSGEGPWYNHTKQPLQAVYGLHIHLLWLAYWIWGLSHILRRAAIAPQRVLQGHPQIENRVKKLRELEAQQKEIEAQAEAIRAELKADLEEKGLDELKTSCLQFFTPCRGPSLVVRCSLVLVL